MGRHVLPGHLSPQVRHPPPAAASPAWPPAEWPRAPGPGPGTETEWTPPRPGGPCTCPSPHLLLLPLLSPGSALLQPGPPPLRIPAPSYPISSQASPQSRPPSPAGPGAALLSVGSSVFPRLQPLRPAGRTRGRGLGLPASSLSPQLGKQRPLTGGAPQRHSWVSPRPGLGPAQGKQGSVPAPRWQVEPAALGSGSRTAGCAAWGSLLSLSEPPCPHA